jgi:glycosyltransferase involved in cell wall biosynthesis
VVIPSFRAARTIAAVLAKIGPEVCRIYVVDDGCPERTGARVVKQNTDARVTVLRNPQNLGVGGAMKLGYGHALADGADIIVKLDADGQMDPRHIPCLIGPLTQGSADYAKGNRFAMTWRVPPGETAGLLAMPAARRWANRLLAATHGFATGYWRVADPANGYTAITAHALGKIPVNALSNCYFFETDMLFRLSLSRAAVVEVPLPARYAGAISSLSLTRVAPRFAGLLLLRSLHRMWWRCFAAPAAVTARAG